jgi:hypothetical protein
MWAWEDRLVLCRNLELGLWERNMNKVCVMMMLTIMLPGCAVPTAVWRGKVEWPDEASAKNVVAGLEAGAALAAAAAVQEMIAQAKDPRLFRGCYSPEQGLSVSVFTGPTPGLYYVKLNQRFDRCGGPRGRVLDWWYLYAVTPQGKVVGEAPPMMKEAEVMESGEAHEDHDQEASDP